MVDPGKGKADLNHAHRTITRVWLGMSACAVLLGAGCAETTLPADGGPDAAAISSAAGDALVEATPPGAADAALDAGTAGDAGPWEPELALCPHAGTACRPGAWSSFFDEWSTLLQAQQFGTGTRFRALHGMTVALEDASGNWSVVQVHFTQMPGPQRYVQYALPAGLRAVATNERLPGLLVLTCSAPDRPCEILAPATPLGGRIDTDGGVLESSNTPSVPSSVAARGMYSGIEGLCVYGRGLWCLRGTSWESQLPQEPEIRSVEVRDNHTAIETQTGTYWISNADMAGHVSFQAYADRSLLDPPPDQRARWTQLRGQQLWFWNGSELAPCASTPPLAAYQPGQALAADGTVFVYDHQQQRYCEGQQLGPIEPVIGISHPTCGIVTNSFVLTESKLRGTVTCAVD